ncbi:MAG TPA: histidine phosphatase family protein [Anaerolineae bacterium]|nr:histidine phosphatase family protein [Anaerolineae bacterium]HQK15450.1 histidine phosphatase family protein [Anaerolineae bacterium]
MKLLLARHGQSEWQVKAMDGDPDPPLTPLGESQAQRLGEYLAAADDPITAIIASPYQRARCTAEIVASYLGLPVVIEPDFREFDEWAAGWAPLPVSMWDMTPADPELKPGYSRFRARVLAALQRVVAGFDNTAQLLIVSHAGTIGTQVRILMGSDTPRLWLCNTSLSLFEWGHPEREGSWLIHYLNRVEHLPPPLRTA